MITYIYTLSHPITNEIKYVGKTINLKQRLSAHISDAKINKKNNLVSTWIKSLLNQNLKPNIEVIDETYHDDWSKLEQYWISQFKTWGFNIKNITLGGEGACGRIWSKSSIDKISATRINKIRSGEIIPTKHTEEWKEIIRNRYSINDNKIKELFNQNKTADEISKELNISTKTVYQRLKKYNLFYLKNKYIINDNTIHEMIQSGLNYIQIAKKLNLSISVISKRYRASKYYINKRSKWDN